MTRTLRLAATRYFQENYRLYVFTTVLFIVGMAFGAVVVNALAPGQKVDLFNNLKGFVNAINDNTHLAGPSTVVWQSIAKNIKLIGMIWILGLSIIGLPLIVVLVFIKGFGVGFTVGFLVEQYARKGIAFALLAVLPQNILFVPALVIAAVAGTSFSLTLIRSRFSPGRIPLYQKLLSYSALILLLSLIMVASSFVEGFVSPNLMKMITPYL